MRDAELAQREAELAAERERAKRLEEERLRKEQELETPTAYIPGTYEHELGPAALGPRRGPPRARPLPGAATALEREFAADWTCPPTAPAQAWALTKKCKK